MSVPTTPSASSTSVSPDPRRSGTSRTGAEDRNVPSFRAVFRKAPSRISRRKETADDKNRLLQSGTRRRKGRARP